MNEQQVITRSRSNVSDRPVKTAKYQITIVMNEDDPEIDDLQAKQLLAKEFQRALDAGFFEDIRYDTLQFDVTSREVLDVAPPNENFDE